MSDLVKARSKTYWAEQSSCMEETFGTVQRALDAQHEAILRALRALNLVDHPVSSRDEVHLDVAYRVLTNAVQLSEPMCGDPAPHAPHSWPTRFNEDHVCAGVSSQTPDVKP